MVASTIALACLIVSDDDGVCLFTRGEDDEVLAAAEKRLAIDEAKRARLVAGKFGLNIHNILPTLQQNCLKYV